MELLSFEYQGHASYGAMKDGKVVDLGRLLGPKFPSLRHLLAADAVSEAGRALETATPDLTLNQISFLPVIADPAKIICIGINYAAHAAEGGHQRPTRPPVFTRWADSLVGHERPIIRPAVSTMYDWEVELCVVIARRAWQVAAKDALSHVAGYTIVNEGSVRDWQRHSPQFIPGKNFYRSGAIGPWMVTSDEISNPSGLRLTTKLNGEVMQDSNTSDLIFDVPYLIEYLSTFTPLEPGDLISTGTPSGVGFPRKPPIFMKPGDIMELEIERIGILRNKVSE